MTRDEINVFIDENTSDEDKVVLADDLEKAFMGLSQEEDGVRAVYSIEKCIEVLSGEMSHEEATEYFWYNVAGSKGENYPLFINTPEERSDVSWTVNSSYLT